MTGDPYSPERRTALVLSGVGTAGAYHAGVLRALQEAGVKIDVVAGRGIGAVGALFSAVDGGQRLWDEKGFWRAKGIERLYAWRPMVRLVGWALIAAVLLVAVPLAAVAAGIFVFPVDFVLKMLGASGSGGLVGWYVAFAQDAFAPTALPTWLPRLVVLVLGAAGVAAGVGALLARDGHRQRGPAWWMALRPPLSAAKATELCWSSMWDLIRGAVAIETPGPVELARRYAEVLVENIGQPGFRELLIVVHDLDARRDLVFALVSESRRPGLVRRPTADETERRRGDVLDLAGASRDHLVDAVAGSLSVALATEPHRMKFPPDVYWRGETHRLSDRTASLCRIVEELESLGVEQVLLVSAAPGPGGPHGLSPERIDGTGRIGEYLQSSEAASVRDVIASRRQGALRLFTIQPVHNPVGPFEFAGGFDDRSDRREPLAELMSRGYEDAYHQFIDPMVGASGERVGGVARTEAVAEGLDGPILH